MKKTAIATIVISLFSTTIFATVVSAETLPISKPTDAQIQFTTDDEEEGFLIKPNPDRENPDQHDYLKPDGGASTKGPLRIQYVPDLNFGIKGGLSSQKLTAFAKPMAYSPATVLPEGVTNSQTIAGNMVPFVQVTDNRGLSNEAFLAEKGWNLTVSSSKFVAEAQVGHAAHTLEAAKIYLKGSTITTTNGSAEDAQKLVYGFNVDNSDEEAGLIPYAGVGTLVILQTHKELTANTNGHQVSNVFANSYRKTDAPAATDDIESIKFVKPAGQAPLAGRLYKATLTWTLTDGL